MYERSVVAAVLTNGLLDAVQPGTDAQVAAKRVVILCTKLFYPSWLGTICQPATVTQANYVGSKRCGGNA